MQPLPVPATRGPLQPGGARSRRLASYQIQARYRPHTQRITATQVLTWTNPAQGPVARLPLHLYMNAFKNENTVFMRESGGTHRMTRASGQGWGWIELGRVRHAGGGPVLPVTYPGPDETVAEVALPAPLMPGDSIALHMEFEVQLPQAFARTGHVGDFAMVGQWFPKIGVLVGAPGQERWHCEPFHANSEFFADFGTYDVTLTLPQTHVVAATGVLVRAQDHHDGSRTLHYRAEDVHDFAWMADPYMVVRRGTARTPAGAVDVAVYHRPEQARWAGRHLRAAIFAVEQFSRLLLPYPWTSLSVVSPPVAASLATGGMEYPTLVTTLGDFWFLPDGAHLAEYVTIHEVGHNWLQGIVASNEVDEAWLDEGINDYLDGVVLGALLGEATSAVDWRGIRADAFRARMALAVPFAALPEAIARPSYRFPTQDSYQGATYGKTALALRTLENLYGSERLLAALRSYARQYAFQHPTGAQFFAALEQALGEDLAWFVRPVFQERGAAHFRVHSQHCRPGRDARGVFGTGAARKIVTEREAPDRPGWTCEVVVTNRGTLPVPTEVEFRFADGSQIRQRWSERTFWKRFVVQRSTPLAAVVIDPDQQVLLDDGAASSGARLRPDTTAANRIASRTQFWTQTLMQVVGL